MGNRVLVIVVGIIGFGWGTGCAMQAGNRASEGGGPADNPGAWCGDDGYWAGAVLPDEIVTDIRIDTAFDGSVRCDMQHFGDTCSITADRATCTAHFEVHGESGTLTCALDVAAPTIMDANCTLTRESGTPYEATFVYTWYGLEPRSVDDAI